MLTIEEIIEKLKDRKITVVASLTGLSSGAIYNIIKKKSFPSYDTLVKLSNYLDEK